VESPEAFSLSIFRGELWIRSEVNGVWTSKETINAADLVRKMVLDCPTGLTCPKRNYENVICNKKYNHGLFLSQMNKLTILFDQNAPSRVRCE
jgi:hypothetical protein